MSLSASRQCRGFSMVEMIISIVIVGIAVTSIITVMGRTVTNSGDAMIKHQAIFIAEAYLAEILAKDFLDPDTSTVCPAAEGGGRDVWDNVCDYNGLSDTGAEDQQAQAITGLENYSVAVTVDTSADLNDLSGSTETLRVDVQVTHSADVDITLSGYRTNY